MAKKKNLKNKSNEDKVALSDIKTCFKIKIIKTESSHQGAYFLEIRDRHYDKYN